MIQVDDSGWGCLLGGVIIGIYDTNRQRMFSKPINVFYFQGSMFQTKKYQKKALEIVKEAFFELGVYTLDKPLIQCCRGAVLLHVRKWLEEIKDKYWCGRIELSEVKEPLQPLLETRFSKYIGRYGIPNKSGSGAHRMSFNDTLEWVKGEPKRIKYVKTGWNSWKDKYSKENGGK